MRELLPDIERWLSEGKSVAVATITQTWGSAPRVAGSKMAVSSAGDMAGSVSGGCVESAVVQEALDALKAGRPKRLHYGVSDEAAWEVGLACGGQIDLLVEPLAAWERRAPGEPSALEALSEALRLEQPVVRACVLQGVQAPTGAWLIVRHDGQTVGQLPEPLQAGVAAEARHRLGGGTAGARTHVVAGEQVEVFYDLLLPPPTLVIVGGVHIGIELARQAKQLGYRVAVVDPRRAFGTEARFPMADRIVREWPDRALAEVGLTAATAVVALSHDPKLDDPALLTALPSAAFYVGALGSQATNRTRQARLLAAGLSREQLERLRAPIGLDLGGRAPEEIALSIMAEIVAVRAGSRLAARGAPQGGGPSEGYDTASTK